MSENANAEQDWKEALSVFINRSWVKALLFFFIGALISGLFATQINDFRKMGYLGGDSSDNSLLGIFITYGINQIGILLVLWFFRNRIDKLSIGSLGFKWRGFGLDALMGLAVAVVTISVGTFLLYYGDNLTIKSVHFDLSNTLLAIVYLIVVALAEEVVFRGYILNNLMQSMNRWLALLLSAFLFTLAHLGNPDIGLFSEITIFIAGVLLGVNYIYTKNLWFAVFFHFAWNLYQGTILGYHVSGIKVDTAFFQIVTRGSDEITGGQFGFEGSLFAALLELIAIAALAMYYERKYGKKLIKAATA